MNILNNIAGAAGFSFGNLTSKALKFVGLPEGIASAVGLVMDVKNGNIGSALFKTGPALLQALTGGSAGQSNSVERPSSTILGTVAKVAGFAALGVGGASLLGAGASALGAGTALGGLSGMLKGILGIAGGLGLAAVGGSAGKMLFDVVGMGGVGGGIETKTALGMSRTQGGADSMLRRLPTPAMFEDIVAAFLVDFVKDKQNEIEEKLETLRQSAQNAGDTAGDKVSGAVKGTASTVTGGLAGKAIDAKNSSTGESRNIEFEMLKNEMQKLSQMQQAMSGVLNSMNEMSMNAIKNIR